MSLHPATELVPPAPADALAHPNLAPVEVLPDGRILVGRAQFELAHRTKQRKLPTLVVCIPEDGAEMYVLDHALRSQYLTDDQRAALAVEYADRLSARMRRERARRAAAVRYGAAACRPPGAKKQDARTEACVRFQITSKRFRQLRKLRGHDAQLYQQVRSGSITLKQAREQVAAAESAAIDQRRVAAAPSSELPELILGDALDVIPGLPDGHFTALVTDPPYGVNYRQEWRGKAEVMIAGDGDLREALSLFRNVLAAASPKLRHDAFLLSFVPAKFEPEFRNVVATLGWDVIGHLIWVKNTRVLFPQTNLASVHERMILAVRGDARVRIPLTDVHRHGRTRSSRHPAEKPVALLAKLIDAITVKGEAVLDPFAGTGATVIAAKKLQRRAVGIEIDARWQGEAVGRLQSTTTRARGHKEKSSLPKPH